MNPENKKLELLVSWGVLLKVHVQITPEQESIQLADIKKWHSLADRCINLWNEYNYGYSLRSRRACCPLCESR